MQYEERKLKIRLDKLQIGDFTCDSNPVGDELESSGTFMDWMRNGKDKEDAGTNIVKGT